MVGRGRPDDELLALYALDALGDEERAEVERAVASSPAWADRLAEHRATAAALAESVSVAPPDELKRRVIDAAFAAQPPTPRSELAAPSVVVPLHRPSPSRRWTMVVAGLAAAAAIVVGLVVVTRPDGSPVTARAMLVGDAGSIEVRIDGSTVALDGHDVTPVPADETYQLWLVQPDQSVRSAGLFSPSGDGSVDTELTVDIADATGLAVTLEPAGGSSPGPTGPVRFTATL